MYNYHISGLPGYPAEPQNGMEGPRGPSGLPGVVGQPGMVGIVGVSGFCEARDCSIHAPVMHKEQGLVKRSAGSKLWTWKENEEDCCKITQGLKIPLVATSVFISLIKMKLQV